MTDLELFRHTVRVTCGPTGRYRFSQLLQHRSPSRVYAWHRGDRPVPPWLLLLCELMLDVPGVVEWMRTAADATAAVTRPRREIL